MKVTRFIFIHLWTFLLSFATPPKKDLFLIELLTCRSRGLDCLD